MITGGVIVVGTLSGNEIPSTGRERVEKKASKEPSTADDLIERTTTEENRIRKCIEAIRSRLGKRTRPLSVIRLALHFPGFSPFI